jgi:hypothetical protein
MGVGYIYVESTKLKKKKRSINSMEPRGAVDGEEDGGGDE